MLLLSHLSRRVFQAQTHLTKYLRESVSILCDCVTETCEKAQRVSRQDETPGHRALCHSTFTILIPRTDQHRAISRNSTLTFYRMAGGMKQRQNNAAFPPVSEFDSLWKMGLRAVMIGQPRCPPKRKMAASLAAISPVAIPDSEPGTRYSQPGIRSYLPAVAPAAVGIMPAMAMLSIRATTFSMLAPVSVQAST